MLAVKFACMVCIFILYLIPKIILKIIKTAQNFINSIYLLDLARLGCSQPLCHLGRSVKILYKISLSQLRY